MRLTRRGYQAMHAARTQERAIDTGISGIRWFELTEDLAAGSFAQAWQSRWNGTAWIPDTALPKVRLYSVAGTITASSGDGVAAWLNARSRHWEVISGAADLPGVPFKNVSGETMPPGAVIWAASGADIGGVPYVLGQKPTRFFFDIFWLINGQTAIANNGFGLGSFLTDLTGLVALDEPYTPQSGDSWGPKPGAWGLGRDREGFTPLTDDTVYTISGQRCAHFKQRVVDEVFGIYTTDCAEGGIGELEIYRRDRTNNNKPLPAGWSTISVFNWWLQQGEVIKKGTKGAAHWKSGAGGYWDGGLTHCKPSNTSESQNAPRLGGMHATNQLLLGQLGGIASPAGVSVSGVTVPDPLTLANTLSLALDIPFAFPVEDSFLLGA